MAKPNTAIYIALYKLLYIDIAECYVGGHTLVDQIAELRSATRTGGIGFLTKTLPSYGKRLDKALSGTVKFDCAGLTAGVNGYPIFSGALLKEVFDLHPREGEVELWLKAQPNVAAIRHLRQLYYYMYKLELDHDEETTKQVIDQFVATDRGLPEMEACGPVVEEILERAGIFTCRVFGSFDHRSIVPRHGPGSVATGESHEGKLSFSRLYKNLDVEYPFTGYFMSGLNHVADEPGYLDAVQVASRGQARVVLVPKDSKGPRLISMEPLEYQWIQQGLMRAIVPLLESHKLTRGHINFRDQQINRRLALESSKTQEWATLDMKEASDRVSLSLVKRLFAHCPCLDGLLAARTEDTMLPDGTVITLKKFAPMGSAICFPVEAFVFYALGVSVLMHVLGYSLKRARRAIYVYGDDLIVRKETVPTLLQYFPLVGLKFNDDKCCISGFFRESCGCDAYSGVDITPIRLRKRLEHLASRKRHLCAVTIASTVMQSNQLHERGCYRAAEYLRQMVEGRVGPLPMCSSNASLDVVSESPTGEIRGVLAFVRPEVATRDWNRRFRMRMHPKYQQFQLQSWRVSVPTYRKPTNSWRSVLKWFSQPSSHTPTDTYADPSRIQLKKGWSNYIP